MDINNVFEEMNTNLFEKKYIKKENKDTNLDINSYKDLLMFYHTSIRNVALSTTVSFAALTYSRYYREKSKIYTSGMILVSILLLFISFILNLHIYHNIQKYKNFKKINNLEINILEINNYFFFICHIILILFAIYTLYRVISGKLF